METQDPTRHHGLEAVGRSLPLDGADGGPAVRLADLTGLTRLVETTGCPDPQAAYGRLRAQWGTVAPVELEPGVNAWLVLGYHEIRDVCRNERLFSADPSLWGPHQQGRVSQDVDVLATMTPLRHSVRHGDGPEHRRLREPLDDGIAVLDEHATASMIRDMCLSLIERFADRGSADLVLEYAGVVPLLAVAGMVGLDQAEQARVMDLGVAMSGVGPQAESARLRLREMLADVVEVRRRAPARDLASVLARHVNLRGDDEVVESMMVMFTAGYDMTIAWTTGVLRLVLTDARFAGRVLGGRLGVDDALDEVLWRDPPISNLPARYARADCVLDGTEISAGDALVLAIAAGNADPRVHVDDPWAEQGNRAHLGWGAGAHACPASRHGRLIVRSAVDAVLHELEDLRLAVPADQVPLLVRPWSRYPKSLPVTFRPRGARAAAAGYPPAAPPSGTQKP